MSDERYDTSTALAILRQGGDVCGPCNLGVVCVSTHEPHPDCPIEAALGTIEAALTAANKEAQTLQIMCEYLAEQLAKRAERVRFQMPVGPIAPDKSNDWRIEQRSWMDAARESASGASPTEEE